MDKSINEKIEELTRRIQEMSRQQTAFGQQLLMLINELELLKIKAAARPVPVQPQTGTGTTVQQITAVPVVHSEQAPLPPPPAATKSNIKNSNATFEEFIGKNVASKVGILITIIGIFIGAKYAIEHNMVVPRVRVISGYLSGLVLIGIAIKLKKKYEAYSSVLMGGGLAVLYFITFTAYSFYALLPLSVAFAMMLLFTVATVYASFVYNRVIIAHLGQIGAYAVPFLLSDNSGRYAVFFSYIAIINTGILIVSFRKYWKSLFYAAFALSWIIYGCWYAFEYQPALHLYLAWTFLCVFFLTFYATFLAYKIIKKEQYSIDDVVILLTNAFVFYGIGFGLVMGDGNNSREAALFTLLNAAVHLAVSQVIRRLQLADRSLYYLLLGLVIVFCTIAVPVAFDGNWVTLLWTAETVLVFLIGRIRKAGAYEKLGCVLAILSFISLMQDWANYWIGITESHAKLFHPFLNINFISSILVAAAQGTIIYFNRNKKYLSALTENSIYRVFYDYVLPVIFIGIAYFTFFNDINGFFNQQQLTLNLHRNDFYVLDNVVDRFTVVVLLLYSMVFDWVLMIANLKWIRNKALALFSLIGLGLLMVILLSYGLGAVNELSVNYMQHHPTGLSYGIMDWFIRYISIGITTLLLFTGRTVVRQFQQDPVVRNTWSLAVHTVVLGLISAEYLCYTTAGSADRQYKLGLSIIWGVYALGLVVWGIRKKLKYLRMGAIALFLITLVKLFLYDLAGAGTITKTVSFISLGVILLLVSYLYNRYKEVLFGSDEAS